MSMRKKDYQAIARAIHRALLEFPSERPMQDDRYGDSVKTWPGAVGVIIHELTAAFSVDNPHFDRARFLEACETGRCRGMKAK